MYLTTIPEITAMSRAYIIFRCGPFAYHGISMIISVHDKCAQFIPRRYGPPATGHQVYGLARSLAHDQPDGKTYRQRQGYQMPKGQAETFNRGLAPESLNKTHYPLTYKQSHPPKNNTHRNIEHGCCESCWQRSELYDSCYQDRTEYACE